MNAISSPARASLAALLLGALTVGFGLQLLRVLIVEMAVYLTQVRDVSSMLVGVMGLGVFLCGFLEPVVRRVLGERNALRVVLGGLALVRLAEQAVTSLSVDLGLSIAGTVLFLWSLPLLFRLVRTEGRASGAHAAIAFLLGLSVDTALKSAFGTIDLSWVPSGGANVVVLALAIAQGLLLWRLPSDGREASDRKAEEQGAPASAWPYLAFGPALALELLLFQNVAQQTALIGWPQPAVYAWILGANLTGVAVAVEVTRRDGPLPWPVMALLAALLIGMAAVELSGALAALVVLAGHLVIAVALASVVQGTASPSARLFGRRRLGLDERRHGAHAGAVVRLLRKLRHRHLGAEGGRASGGRSVGRSGRSPCRLRPPRRWSAGNIDHEVGGSARVAPASAPLASTGDLEGRDAGHRRRLPYPGDDLQPPRRVRCPWTPCPGGDALEEMAKVIEAEDPDVIALQEVSRGWVVNGSVDMLAWLSQRLDMDYVWGPAAAPLPPLSSES